MGNQPHWTRPRALDDRTVAAPGRKDEFWPKGVRGKTEPAGNEPKSSHQNGGGQESRTKAKEKTEKGGGGTPPRAIPRLAEAPPANRTGWNKPDSGGFFFPFFLSTS